MEGLLVVEQLLPLLVRIVVGDVRVEVRGVGCLLPLALALLVQLLLVLEHLLALLEALVHLHALLDEELLLLHLLVALVALLHDALLEAMQLRLGHLLGMVRVVREQEQLLVVALLRLESSLDGDELVVEAVALLLEALDNGLVGLADALGLVVLDHRLVQPVLQDPDLPHLRRGLARVHPCARIELIELDGELVEGGALLGVFGLQCVHSALQDLDVGHRPFKLLFHRLRFLIPQLCNLIAQRLVLLLHLADNLLVLLDVQLCSVIGRLALALQQLEAALQILQLLLRSHRCFGRHCPNVAHGTGRAVQGCKA
mmetsp:Transcript_117575/g.366240  ORF Transcript_117575/g.366240 Transcript_117575/m.366240 type:complete len:314 (-) Transcript_117575:7-948(-)